MASAPVTGTPSRLAAARPFFSSMSNQGAEVSTANAMASDSPSSKPARRRLVASAGWAMAVTQPPGVSCREERGTPLAMRECQHFLPHGFGDAHDLQLVPHEIESPDDGQIGERRGVTDDQRHTRRRPPFPRHRNAGRSRAGSARARTRKGADSPRGPHCRKTPTRGTRHRRDARPDISRDKGVSASRFTPRAAAGVRTHFATARHGRDRSLLACTGEGRPRSRRPWKRSKPCAPAGKFAAGAFPISTPMTGRNSAPKPMTARRIRCSITSKRARLSSNCCRGVRGAKCR